MLVMYSAYGGPLRLPPPTAGGGLHRRRQSHPPWERLSPVSSRTPRASTTTAMLRPLCGNNSVLNPIVVRAHGWGHCRRWRRRGEPRASAAVAQRALAAGCGNRDRVEMGLSVNDAMPGSTTVAVPVVAAASLSGLRSHHLSSTVRRRRNKPRDLAAVWGSNKREDQTWGNGATVENEED
jgi:hypothetical protein